MVIKHYMLNGKNNKGDKTMRYFKSLLIVTCLFLLAACSFGGGGSDYSIHFVTNGGKEIKDMTVLIRNCLLE